MIRSHRDGRAAAEPRAWRCDGRAIAVSMLLHGLALLAAGFLVRPIPSSPPSPGASREEVVYLDFPTLPSAPTSRGGGPPRAQRALRPATATPASGGEVGGMAAVSTGPAATDPAGAGSVEGAPVAPEAPGARLRAGFRDARLYVDPPPLAPAAPRPAHERLVADAGAAILTEPAREAAAKRKERESRQVTILGRRVTIFGDSAAAGFRTAGMELRRDVQTMPEDPRSWERLQMSLQRDRFSRDSLLRERSRATRERATSRRR